MTAAQAVDKLMGSEHADVIRESVAFMVDALMEAEVSAMIGAEFGERAPERRSSQRNGYRDRRWDTRVGAIELAIPKLRSGLGYFPSFRGWREVIGLEVGEIESEAFWREFLRSLKRRGLDGVRLCVSDAHEGLTNAIARVLGCPWQRCTVHFVRDMHQHCRPAQRALVSAALREVFNADGYDQARERVTHVIEQLTPTAPKVAELLAGAEEDLLAFYRFPAEHWTKLRSTNPLERVNREIGRRTDVVGIFPNDASLIRLAGMLLIEQNDEWLVGRRYLSQESLAALAVQETELSAPRTAKQRNINWKRKRKRQRRSPPSPPEGSFSPTIPSYTTKRDLTPAN